jgi:uncharacterized membrane protein (UPF0127 family)
MLRLGLAMVAATLVACAGCEGTKDAAKSGEASVTAGSQSSSATPTVTVRVGPSAPLRVEVAATEEQRELGLMDRDSVPAGTGMIFVFPRAERGSFWMYRTRVPLSIAWAAGGRVVGVAEMEPCRSPDSATCPTYPSPQRFDIAVEAPAGTFTSAGVKAGDRVLITGALPSASD